MCVRKKENRQLRSSINGANFNFFFFLIFFLKVETHHVRV